MKKLHNEHLDWLEAESVYIIREVAAECRNPALLFSGGKDSVVLLALARKAFHVAGRNIPLPFPLLHIDTGHNYPEVIAFRDENRGALPGAAHRRQRRRLHRARHRSTAARERLAQRRAGGNALGSHRRKRL